MLLARRDPHAAHVGSPGGSGNTQKVRLGRSSFGAAAGVLGLSVAGFVEALVARALAEAGLIEQPAASSTTPECQP